MHMTPHITRSSPNDARASHILQALYSPYAQLRATIAPMPPALRAPSTSRTPRTCEPERAAGQARRRRFKASAAHDHTRARGALAAFSKPRRQSPCCRGERRRSRKRALRMFWRRIAMVITSVLCSYSAFYVLLPMFYSCVLRLTRPWFVVRYFGF
ncbi:hypothetical protein DENSPDRAFT_102669 [Dentipellis sp. KUC8613]|nr:hypothetical protein DENSPDRAFT_102669 [Dentipellis sp. KUC8613]